MASRDGLFVEGYAASASLLLGIGVAHSSGWVSDCTPHATRRSSQNTPLLPPPMLRSHYPPYNATMLAYQYKKNVLQKKHRAAVPLAIGCSRRVSNHKKISFKNVCLTHTFEKHRSSVDGRSASKPRHSKYISACSVSVFSCFLLVLGSSLDGISFDMVDRKRGVA